MHGHRDTLVPAYLEREQKAVVYADDVNLSSGRNNPNPSSLRGHLCFGFLINLHFYATHSSANNVLFKWLLTPLSVPIEAWSSYCVTFQTIGSTNGFLKST